MIILKPHEDHFHLYSDEGKKIKHIPSGRVYVEAIDKPENIGKYEEVEVSANG